MVCLGRPYHFKFFKGCLPSILLGPFLNGLHICYCSQPVQLVSANVIVKQRNTMKIKNVPREGKTCMHA